jgi:tetratricopeptide (TPR) repeat protein
VHLAGSSIARSQLEELKGLLEKAGLHVFADPIEPVPPPEWQRRSEQILFHSKVLVLIDSVVTGAQHEAIATLLRANRGGKNRPVRVISVNGNPDALLAREFQQDGALHLPRRSADQPIEAQKLIEWINSVERPSGFHASLRRRPATAAQPAIPAASPPGSVSVAPAQPFRGADAFREEAAAYFFGREQLVSNLVAAIESHPRVWLLGPSGCGKTSAVLAGVFPQLRAKSTERVLERIEIRQNCVDDLSSVINRMPRNGARHVLFVDEFERLLGLSNAEADAILGALTQVSNERPDVVVLIGAREDSASYFHEPPLALPKDDGSVVRVPDFTSGELLAIIERPAQRSGLAYEPGLVDRITTDAGLQTSALRLIQRTLLRLWENRREGFLTNSAYEAIGGVGAVVGEIGDAALASYSGDTGIVDRILSRLVFLDIITTPQAQGVREDSAHEQPAMVLRRRLAVPVKDVIPVSDTQGLYRQVIDLLTNNGLLVARANEAEEPCIELVHELVLSRSKLLVEQLNELVKSDREFLLWRQRFGFMISRGEEIKGKALSAARGWLNTRSADLNLVERHAIQSAIRERRALRVIAAVVLGLIAFFVVREVRKDARDAAFTTVAEADRLAAQGDWYGALDSLRAVPSSYPHQDSVALKRARANMQLGDLDGSIKDFTEAHQLNPSLVAAIVERGDAYVSQGRDKEAMADYEAALRLDPNDDQALFGRGGTRLRLKGSTDSSLVDFAASFKADTTRADALFARGNLNQSLGRDQDAARDFTEVLAHSSDGNLVAGARSRLDSLGKKVLPGPEPGHAQSHARKLSIFIQFSDERDRSAVDAVAKQIAGNSAFVVPRIEHVGDSLEPATAELRFREGDDRLVKDALVTAEAALAKVGYPLRLTPRMLNAKQFPNAIAGRLEVWLPSLSRSSYTRQSSLRKG